MPKLQKLLLTVATAALLTPSASLAAGPSAGDQQYCDPLTGCNSSATHHTPIASGGSANSSGSGSAGASGPSSATASAPSGTSSGSSAPTGSAPTGSTPNGTSTTGASSSSAGKQLARTGIDVGLISLLGVGMLGGGLVLRRRALQG